MTDDDFLELIGEVKRQLVSVGLPELADDDRYRIGEGAESRLPTPQEQLEKMLAAFERVIAIHDRRTITEAMNRIAKATEGPAPSGAVIVGLAREGDEVSEVNLLDAPDLSQVRSSTHELIGQLRETPRER
jgi:hypothetical protein